MWETYSEIQYNVSPQTSRSVLAALDPDLVERYNQTLRFQWEVYEHAVGLFQHR